MVAPDETPSPLHLRHQATNLPTKTPNLLTGRAWNGGGGDEEDRTPDLGIANAALSQLSYVPTIKRMIPPLWSIPNRQPRQLADERPRRCGKRNTPATTPVLAMRPP